MEKKDLTFTFDPNDFDGMCELMDKYGDRAEFGDASLENLGIRIGEEHYSEYLAHFLVCHRLSSLAYI